MDKNVKKIISEAFSELYEDFLGEEKLKTRAIRDEEVQTLAKRAMERGTAIPYDFEGGDLKSKKNFDKIMDILVGDYKNTGNPKSKEAIQTSMYPYSGSEIRHSIGGDKFYGNPDMDDAAAAAYEQVVLNSFDNIIGLYKPGSNLGAIFVKDMKNKVYNYLVKGYRGTNDGGSKFDAAGGDEKPFRFDAPIGDKGGETFGDKIAAMTTGPNSAEEKGNERERAISIRKKMVDDAIQWLDDFFDEEGNPTNIKRMIAVRGFFDYDTPEQIMEDNPGVFSKTQVVVSYFYDIIKSEAAKEASELISHIYGIPFDLSKVNHNDLVATYSMDPKRGDTGYTQRDRTYTDSMNKVKNQLDDKLKAVGYKYADIESKNKLDKFTVDMESKGMDDELEEILQLNDELIDVTNREKEAGNFDVNAPILPTKQGHEEKDTMYNGVYENFISVELMKRVLKRLNN